MLLDTELLEGDGLAVLKQLQNPEMRTKVLVVSACQSDLCIFQTIQARSVGYMFKNQISMQLWDAITTVIQGDVFMSREALTAFVRQFQTMQTSAPLPIDLPCEPFSPREKEVLFWLVKVDGITNKKIAEKLYLTESTIKFHVSNIIWKLDSKNRTEVTAKAIKLNLLEP
jgi:DNA-binding NarL/FixJ family response regulator